MSHPQSRRLAIGSDVKNAKSVAPVCEFDRYRKFGTGNSMKSRYIHSQCLKSFRQDGILNTQLKLLKSSRFPFPLHEILSANIPNFFVGTFPTS